MRQPNLPSFIWSLVELPHGDCRQFEFGKDIMSHAVLRRLDCVPEIDTKLKEVTDRMGLSK